MSNQAITPAYYSKDMTEYARHGTVFFTFSDEAEISLELFLKSRVGFHAMPTLPKARHIVPHMRSASYNQAQRADLVVTDNPIGVYGFIDKSKIQLWFKIGEIKEAATNAGISVDTWEELWALPAEKRAVVLATPLMMKCQKERKSEGDLLGYQRYSWEEFTRAFTLVHDEYNGTLAAFPTEKVTSYGLWRNWVQDFDGYPEMTIVFDNEVGGEEKIWVSQTNSENLFNALDTGRGQMLVSPDDFHKITGAIDRDLGAQVKVRPRLPAMSMSGAPPIMSKLRYVHYLPEKTFLQEDLLQMARDLNLKGYSSKTKAELVIMLAEHLAQAGTEQNDPALIFTNHQQGSPSDIQMDTNSELFKKRTQWKAEDYFKFGARVVSSAAYAPNLPPSPGGRVPVDGSFPSYFGVEPLNIFEEAVH